MPFGDFMRLKHFGLSFIILLMAVALYAQFRHEQTPAFKQADCINQAKQELTYTTFAPPDATSDLPARAAICQQRYP